MKAPGKVHREGLGLAALFRKFPDDATAHRWFVESRWPDGPHCPHCGSLNVLTGAKHPTMPYRCRERECRKHFSVRTGTVMQGSNLGYQTWAVAIYLVLTGLKGTSSMKLHRDLEITQKSAWHLAHRIRESLGHGGGIFSGPVEVDETHFGGKRKNMSARRRREMRQRYGGGGASAMTTVAGARDRETGRIQGRIVPDTTRMTLRGFVDEAVEPDATLYTDEWRSYRGLREDHEAVNHSVGEYVRDQASINGLESFWALMKRGYTGIYHKMSPKHLDRYVGEFAGRHNVRPKDTLDQMTGVVAAMDGKRLRYTDLIADNGLDSGAKPTK